MAITGLSHGDVARRPYKRSGITVLKAPQKSGGIISREIVDFLVVRNNRKTSHFIGKNPLIFTQYILYSQ